MEKNEQQNKVNLKQLPDENIMHQLEQPKIFFSRKSLGIFLIVIFLGILSGYFLATTSLNQKSGSKLVTIENAEMKTGKSVGSTDAKTFRDAAEGRLESGGINGEGTHKLIRPGGESQTVYLTSSVLDLSKYEGKNVRVWGETNAAKRAGWLMDAGRIEIL